MDVLIWRSDSPILLRDGALVVLPAHAVLAAIEIKTRLTARTLSQATDRLRAACEVLPSRRNVALAIFAYESTFRSPEPVLEHLRDSAPQWLHRIDYVCHGPDRFIRYWNTHPEFTQLVHEKWHSYFVRGLAFGYFVSNIVSHLAPEGFPTAGEPFFPNEGKESYKDGEIYRRDAFMERLNAAQEQLPLDPSSSGHD